MTSSTKTVELPNGVALPYAEQGDPTGVPMLLLHGVTDSGIRSNRCCRTCLRRFMLSR
jgi:hypothetical protein